MQDIFCLNLDSGISANFEHNILRLLSGCCAGLEGPCESSFQHDTHLTLINNANTQSTVVAPSFKLNLCEICGQASKTLFMHLINKCGWRSTVSMHCKRK